MSYPVKATLTIYSYAKNGTVVYVGQTRQPLEDRDRQHRGGNGTKFDRDYSGENLKDYSPPVVLETMKTEVEHVSSEVEEAVVMAKWQIWVNDREKYWIKKYSTYSIDGGLNQTEGGQLGVDVAYFEAMLKERRETWNKINLPAFRGSSYGKMKRLWETSKSHKEAGVRTGKILSSIRYGRCSIPISHRLEMESLGFDPDKSMYESRFTVDYLPAFRASSYGKAKRLWETGARSEEAGIKTGVILNRIRSGKCSIPSSHQLEMTSLGFHSDKSFYESRFTVDYLPAFRASSYGKAKRLWETGARSEEAGIKTGTILHSIRSGRSSIPSVHHLEMTSLGFDPNKSIYESRFAVDYLPAFRTSSYGKMKRLWETEERSEEAGIKTGHLIESIRSGITSIPSSHRIEMEELGFTQGKSYLVSRFEVDIMPAIRSCIFAKERRLLGIPWNFTHHGINVGRIINKMSTGTLCVPPSFEEELKLLGFSVRRVNGGAMRRRPTKRVMDDGDESQHRQRKRVLH
jgi:hypothetical protein